MKNCFTILASIICSVCFGQVERSTEALKSRIATAPSMQKLVVQQNAETNSQIRLGPCGRSHSTHKPMVLVDGEIVSYSFLETVNPNDIFSIEILKDPKALSRYGEKAQGGVISIRMKCKEQQTPPA